MKYHYEFGRESGTILAEDYDEARKKLEEQLSIQEEED